jgi:hypothetical protein
MPEVQTTACKKQIDYGNHVNQMADFPSFKLVIDARGTAVAEGKKAWEDVVLKDTWNEQTISLWCGEEGPKSIQMDE